MVRVRVACVGAARRVRPTRRGDARQVRNCGERSRRDGEDAAPVALGRSRGPDVFPLSREPRAYAASTWPCACRGSAAAAACQPARRPAEVRRPGCLASAHGCRTWVGPPRPPGVRRCLLLETRPLLYSPAHSLPGGTVSVSEPLVTAVHAFGVSPGAQRLLVIARSGVTSHSLAINLDWLCPSFVTEHRILRCR
jgi:hypothetical protein